MQEFTVTPYERGKGENTVAFLEYLQGRHPDKKLIILWDKTRYHCGKEIQAYLCPVNQGLEEEAWKVTGLLFASKAPEQNPVEASWLQGKNFLRRHCYEKKTFPQVNPSFLNCLHQQIFNFEKSKWYLEIPQLV